MLCCPRLRSDWHALCVFLLRCICVVVVILLPLTRLVIHFIGIAIIPHLISDYLSIWSQFSRRPFLRTYLAIDFPIAHLICFYSNAQTFDRHQKPINRHVSICFHLVSRWHSVRCLRKRIASIAYSHAAEAVSARIKCCVTLSWYHWCWPCCCLTDWWWWLG